MQWETVIGLEVHAQLKLKSKIFSSASSAFGAEPNTQACIIDLGLPGVLPVLNQDAVRMAVMFGLAVDAQIAETSFFERKNYFYPDLPKGYQISQYQTPIVHTGSLDIILEDGNKKNIRINRAHLEEDAGKSLHEDFAGCSGIDLNRAGVALLEIVSEPDLRNSKEAITYLKTLHSLVRYIGICDGNMQEGSFRCDANVSIRPQGQKEFGTRCEIKNVNSFRFVEKAIEYEISRQQTVLESGGTVVQETRLFDPQKNETRPMRGKEEANDYRYFPDPDLLPTKVEASLIETIKQELPELPMAKLERFCKQYDLSNYDAAILTTSRELADFFEAAVTSAGGSAKLVANWVMGEFLGALNKADLSIELAPINAQTLGTLVKRIADNTISGKIAKGIFEDLWQAKGSDVDQIIAAKGLKQVTDSGAIGKIVDEVLAANPEQIEQYKAGKDRVFGFLVGQVMKASKGKANPKQVNELLKQKLA